MEVCFNYMGVSIKHLKLRFKEDTKGVLKSARNLERARKLKRIKDVGKGNIMGIILKNLSFYN